MYISIGADFSVRDRAVIGIFDLDNTSVSKHTRAFLSEAEAQGEVVDVSGKLPKSLAKLDMRVPLPDGRHVEFEWDKGFYNWRLLK